MWSLAIFQLGAPYANRQHSGLRGSMYVRWVETRRCGCCGCREEHLPNRRRACEGTCEGRAGSILGKLQTTVTDALLWVQ